MERAWWISALQWSLWGVAMTVVMGWIESSRTRTRKGQLFHPLSTPIVGAVCFAFFAGVAIVSNLHPNEP